MPNGNEFEWDEDNEGHIARHGVRPWEAEEAARDRKRISVSTYNFRGERRWALLRATEVGRILAVVFYSSEGNSARGISKGRHESGEAPVQEAVEQ